MKSQFHLELGMPHLGRNNLSESSLFKAIGNDRWKQIEIAGKVPTSLIQDDAGSRLYATFFFLEVHFAPDHPLAAHGENETLHFDTDLWHCRQVHLDGKHVLTDTPQYWIRSSNVFIYQERGPSKLSISIPANMDFSEIPELDEQPDSLAMCRAARAEGRFFAPEPDDVDVYEGERVFHYTFDQDRDMNGAGLIYFANFISILDASERGVLADLPHQIPQSALDARSTWRRRVGYYGNAPATDSLKVFVKTRIRALPDAQHGRLLDLAFDYRIRRVSDEKEIVVSSCRKVSPMKDGSPEAAWFSAMTGGA
ncbi:MAG TPA: LnmK family bifunctional acyltransferase/decarboxylase [Gemmatimonadaceae bacterium]